jgi:CTP synthase
MRILGVHGALAEHAAARQILALRGEGLRVAAARLASAADATLPAGACEFVVAHGALWPNAAFWLEWASGIALLAMDAAADVLVLAADAPRGDIQGADWIPATRGAVDSFGRPLDPRTPAGPALRIGIVGSAQHHRAVNPAVLARLGDAADRCALAVKPVFVPADSAPVHGLILPGGADMAQVAPQIAAAQAALDGGLPAFGLCLGMQSMATALMRATWPDAMPEEVAGPGERRSFVRAARHYLGERAFRPLPGTHLAALLPGGARARINHRYRLNPAFAPPARIVLHAAGEDGIVDALEVPEHPFFIGLQGHPELGVDPALDRLWDAFLAACAAASPARLNAP